MIRALLIWPFVAAQLLCGGARECRPNCCAAACEMQCCGDVAGCTSEPTQFPPPAAKPSVVPLAPLPSPPAAIERGGQEPLACLAPQVTQSFHTAFPFSSSQASLGIWLE
jgi:hypothetical protein